MLNENLARVRRERGLTQEALAIKLNVVRQTISKWENGTAVPDADTLCRIADALEVSVAELLGNPERRDKTDTDVIAKALAEINEQLAVRNRRSGNIIKIILAIVIGLFLLMATVIVLSLCLYTYDDNSVTVEKFDSEVLSVPSIETDENNVPLLKQVSQSNEYALREYFSGRTITGEQLITAWGDPAGQTDRSASWLIGEGKVFTVFFTDNDYAYDCGIEGR